MSSASSNSKETVVLDVEKGDLIPIPVLLDSQPLSNGKPPGSPAGGFGGGTGGPPQGGFSDVGGGKPGGGPPSGGGGGGGGPPGGRPGGGGGPPPPHILAKKGMIALARNGTILFIVFWAAMTWIYGSNSGAQNRVHNLNVLVRDLDGGAFGQALLDAISVVNGQDSYPTFVISTEATTEDLFEQVWNGKYWASISANSGATAAFDAVITSTTDSASYNASSVYTWQAASARYFTSYQGYIYPSVVEILAIAEKMAANYSATAALTSTSTFDATQISIIASPASSTFVDVAPMSFQARVFLNTFGIVISHLTQFFFNMIMNGIFTGVGIYRNTTFKRLLKRKYPIKLLWTVLTSLTITSGAIIFDDGTHVPAKNFFALWTTEWVYAWINFNTMGIILAFVPLPFVAMFVFPSIVTSVAASLIPIELSNQFYRISYIFPSHAYWNTVITVYGRGIVNTLYIYLPILAAWVIVSESVWLFGDWTIAKRSTKPPPSRH